jgi:hypothetical protein
VDDQGEWVGLAQAGQALKLSITTLRRQIKRGEIEARQVNTQHGRIWQVRISTSDQVAADADTLDNQGEQLKVNQAGELPVLFRELQDRMVEKAEAAAMWQARAEMLSFQLHQAQETIKMLEAPKAAESLQEEPEAAGTREVASEPDPDPLKPWWRRVFQWAGV